MTISPRATVEEHITRLCSVLSKALSSRDLHSLDLKTDGLRGRVSAESLIAPMALPSFDNSQMDGFAVRSQDVHLEADRSVTLPVSEVVPAGSSPSALVCGTAAAVMTGAPIPAGANVVIPVEKSAEGFASLEPRETGGPSQVSFVDLELEDLQPGRFIRPVGSAVQVGQTLVEQGQPLTPARLGLLAACGFDRLSVWAPVRSLVISTGSEVRAPGDTLNSAQLYDANTVLLRAGLEGFGHEVSTAHISSDDPTLFVSELQKRLAADRPNIVISAGGVSAGAFEVVREALTGENVTFAPIAQQPGGPQGWGLLPVPGQQEPAAFVGFPGNPVSAAVSLETLVRPALSTVDPGCPPPQHIEVRLGESMASPRGVRQFRRVQLSDAAADTGIPTAYPVGGPSSHLLAHYAAADALLVLFETDQEVVRGDLRPAVLLPGGTTSSHDEAASPEDL